MSAMAKQNRLPNTEGSIPELEQLGYEYASFRDKRQALLKDEVALKNKTLAAMKKHNLTEYKYEDLKIERIPGEEKLKVKVYKDEPGNAE